MALVCLLACTLALFVECKSTVVLSNLELPRDVNGAELITGETSVITVNGTHYFYVNNWGGCRDVDCCPSPGGCADCCYVPSTALYPDPCVFTANHSVHVYATQDLKKWRPLGVALSPEHRRPGIEFRPHVVHNSATGKYVMWYENRPSAIVSSGYAVATSDTPEGPFITVKNEVAVADVPGDFDVLVDGNGTAWHVQTTTNDPNASRGFVITALDASYTGPAVPRRSSAFVAPRPAEGPVLFKHPRHGYYILGGTTCCACRGGASIYVFRAPSPLGPWKYVSDVGSNPARANASFDPHSPDSYVTKAQASAVFESPPGSGQFVWLGNQWVTSGRRNADLLYWTVLNFDEHGDVSQVVWAPNATVRV
jgi:beta-xylosidase